MTTSPLATMIMNASRAVAALMLFAAAGCATAPPMPNRAGAFLTVRGDAGVAVYVDGARLGTSPLERASIGPGRHVVEAALYGFEPQAIEVTVPADHEAIVTFALARKPGTDSFNLPCGLGAPLALASVLGALL